MVKYTTTILRFKSMGEKTGWTYVEIPPDIVQKLKPGFRQSFRVKGKLDDFSIKGVAIMPMGKGVFILPLNAALRKGIGKRHGAMLTLQLQEDKTELKLNADLMACLADDPDALAFFDTLTKSHRFYFSKWIDTAKTEPTKVKRIAMSINALARKMGYPEMLRANKGR